MEHERHDPYEGYEPEAADLVSPYDRFLDELDEPLSALLSDLEHTEDFEADFDEDELQGIYTTVTVEVSAETRAILLEHREAVVEAAGLARINSLVLLSRSRTELLNGNITAAPAAPIDLEPKTIAWGRIDEQLDQLSGRIEQAITPEDFKAVALICREILLTLARVLYDEARHLPKGETAPKSGDFKSRLDAVMAVELSGRENERLRKLAKATWDRTQSAVHGAETPVDAKIAAMSTRQLVTILRLALPRQN